MASLKIIDTNLLVNLLPLTIEVTAKIGWRMKWKLKLYRIFCFHKRSYRELVTDSNVNTDASGKVPKISVLFSQFKTLWQFLGAVPRAPSSTQCTENYAGCNWSLSMIYDFCVICDLQLEKTTGKICWLNSRPPTKPTSTCADLYIPARITSVLLGACILIVTS